MSKQTDIVEEKVYNYSVIFLIVSLLALLLPTFILAIAEVYNTHFYALLFVNLIIVLFLSHRIYHNPWLYKKEYLVTESHDDGRTVTVDQYYIEGNTRYTIYIDKISGERVIKLNRIS